MAQTSGTAADFQAVLTALKAFITADANTPGQDWVCDIDRNARDNAGVDTSWAALTREMVFHNHGDSGTENIIVGIREWKYPAGNAWGWDLNGYLTTPIEWNGNSALHGLTTYDATWQHWSQMPILQLFDSAMAYWFVSSKQRIMVVVRVSSDYFIAYLGHGLRLGSPDEYPNPMVVAGSYVGNVSYQGGGYAPVRPYWHATNPGSVFIIDSGNSYITGHDVFMKPLVTDAGGLNTTAAAIDVASSGEAVIVPCYVKANNYLLQQLDGMLIPRMQSMLSESTYVSGRDTMKIFQNAQLTYNYAFTAVVMATSATTTTTTSSTTTTTTA
jgi:hypothetical protein